jgi:protein disulfide-isomerase-like protein
MAAMDVTKPDNNIISKKYNITGFPTLLYFEDGVMKFPYPGDNKKDALVSFLKNPKPEAEDKPVEKEWKDEPSEVAHLTDDTFETFVQEHNSVLIMFYAPWCGHCKSMKPKFVSAAAKLKPMSIEGKLAAVDCTKATKLAAKFGIKGYPTVKYFKDGTEAFDAGEAREEAAILDFMKDPHPPPPPPPPEKPWSEEEDSDVVHLNEESFKTFLKKTKHVMVMFYAPWCGHCKKAKPEMTTAAYEFRDNPKVKFAAVDCTIERSVCSAYEVSGYPTFKYFQYFNKEQKTYFGGRTMTDFVAFMNDPDNPLSGQEPPKPTPESQWKDHEGAEHVMHLTTETFNEAIKEHDHTLVMFYAPW